MSMLGEKPPDLPPPRSRKRKKKAIAGATLCSKSNPRITLFDAQDKPKAPARLVATFASTSINSHVIIPVAQTTLPEIEESQQYIRLQRPSTVRGTATSRQPTLSPRR